MKLGPAQKLFYEKNSSLISTLKNFINKELQWPQLEKLLESGRILTVDIAFAEQILSKIEGATEAHAAFLCYLLVSAREGHLCVQVLEDQLIPSPLDSWLAPSLKNECDKPSEEDSEYYYDLILEGGKTLPSALFVEEGREEVQLKPLCQEGKNIYLQRHHFYETVFIENLKRLLQDTPEAKVVYEGVLDEVKALKQEGKLLQEQEEAILQACRSSFTIITGGPGTGKTYTAGFLIKILLRNLFHEEQIGLEIAIASPTGKAASNLQESLFRALEGEDFSSSLVAKTMHSLLGLKKFGQFDLNRYKQSLSADIILVDESSMIDVRLMAYLFSSVKKGARLILLGDKDQLPPVEAGSLFADITKLLRESSQFSSHIVELNKCMRVELREILDFAHLVNHGEVPQVIEMLDRSQEGFGIKRLPLVAAGSRLQTSLLQHVQEAFPQKEGESCHPHDLLEEFQRFRILSPLRKGVLGVDALNRFLLNFFRKEHADQSWFVAPIMIVRNHYNLGLFNGEVGLFYHKVDGDQRREDYAVFLGGGEDDLYFDRELQVRKFPAYLLPHYEYAYCLSVHKSQGSEFQKVLLLLPEGSEVFGREVLYTAVTRAKRELEIYAEDHTIKALLERSPHRISGISDRLPSVGNLV